MSQEMSQFYDSMGTGWLRHKTSPQKATPVIFSPFPFPHQSDGNNSCQQAAVERDSLAHLCLPRAFSLERKASI